MQFRPNDDETMENCVPKTQDGKFHHDANRLRSSPTAQYSRSRIHVFSGRGRYLQFEPRLFYNQISRLAGTFSRQLEFLCPINRD